jgi:hypothetical protein
MKTWTLVIYVMMAHDVTVEVMVPGFQTQAICEMQGNYLKGTGVTAKTKILDTVYSCDLHPMAEFDPESATWEGGSPHSHQKQKGPE